VNATLVRALGYPREELFQLSVYEAGVAAFVARLDLPVELDVTSERLHPDIEASAYFIVAEAVTNVVKHAGATQATVEDGLRRIGALAAELDRYHYFHAARADLLRRRGDDPRADYERALELVGNAAERRFLERRLA
jgi:hypothetical protein